ncbi:MAG: hypothetical protein OXC31_22570 [Spirochaetaceae bacterium]|nr:hypothetical protein [Spirochaetaceae bacterium]
MLAINPSPSPSIQRMMIAMQSFFHHAHHARLTRRRLSSAAYPPIGVLDPLVSPRVEDSSARTESSEPTTLRYYRSSDAEITSSDTEVGTHAVAELAASRTTGQSVSLTVPTTAGTYYYGACVDAVSGESDTSDNCSGAARVDVQDPPLLQPHQYLDLEVETPSVDDASPETGTTFTLSATVTNAGNAESATTTLRYYRATDAAMTAYVLQVGTDAVGALAAAGTSDESIPLTASFTSGAYYYRACADAVTGESDTTNN